MYNYNVKGLIINQLYMYMYIVTTEYLDLCDTDIRPLQGLLRTLPKTNVNRACNSQSIQCRNEMHATHMLWS